MARTRELALREMARQGVPTHHTGLEDGDGLPVHEDDVRQFAGGHNEMDEEAGDYADGGPEGMTADEYDAAIAQAVQAAEQYIDMEVSPDREMLRRYYASDERAQPAEPGRSNVVAPEVRNGVLGHMPGLIRTFCGTERYVEFRPGPGTPQGQADFQTDYVAFVIENDTPSAYREILSALDDAVRVRTGVLTWWWEEREEVTRTVFSGLNEDAFALLQMEQTEKSNLDSLYDYHIEITAQEPDTMQDGGSLVPPQFSEMAQAPPGQQAAMQAQGAPPQTFIYDCVLHARVVTKRARFRCVAPEEFIVTPTTTNDLNRYQLIGTREDKTIGDLVALGHSEEEIREALGAPGASTGGNTDGGATTTLGMNPERVQRDGQQGMERLFDTGIALADPSSEIVKYCVVYVLIDADGDGIPERRKICTVGDNHKIIYDEIYEDDTVPFAVGCAYPEPHSPFGWSVSDMLLDVQDVKTELMRGTLDSLAESINSRLAFWQGKVNVDDVLNSRRGAAIRTTDVPSNVIQNLAPPFVGANTMPVIQYVDEDAIKRSGKNPASPTGMDPDSTQSTAREAVGSMIDAANERTEYMARNLAETLFKPFFKGMRGLIVRNQDHKRVITLMGQDVTVDPRPWRADLDVQVNVGTGRTSQTKKAVVLQQVIGTQMQIFQQYGPGNGLVTLENISNAQSDFLRASGFPDPFRYIGRVQPGQEQQMQAAAAQKAAQPTPEQMLAQIQSQKNQMDFAAKMAKLKADQETAVMRDDTQRDTAEQNFSVNVAKILGDYGIKIDEGQVRAAMAANDMAHKQDQLDLQREGQEQQAEQAQAQLAATQAAGANGGNGA